MKQLFFAGAEYRCKRKQTRSERFLYGKGQVLLWQVLIKQIASHNHNEKGGRRAICWCSCCRYSCFRTKAKPV